MLGALLLPEQLVGVKVLLDVLPAALQQLALHNVVSVLPTVLLVVTSGAKGLDVPWGARGLDWPGFRADPGAWGGNLARGKSLGTGCA